MGIYGRLDAAARRDLLKEVSLDKQYYKEHIQNILYDNYVKLALLSVWTRMQIIIKVPLTYLPILKITRDWTAVILMKSENLHICVI